MILTRLVVLEIVVAVEVGVFVEERCSVGTVVIGVVVEETRVGIGTL